MTIPVEVNTPLEPAPPWTSGVSAQSQLANNCGIIPYSQSGSIIPAGTTTSKTFDVITDASFEAQLVLIVKVSAVSGGETLTVQINGKSPSGITYPILTSAALATTGTTTLRVGMSFTPIANLTANDMLPYDMQVVCTVAGTGSITYEVDTIIG